MSFALLTVRAEKECRVPPNFTSAGSTHCLQLVHVYKRFNIDLVDYEKLLANKQNHKNRIYCVLFLFQGKEIKCNEVN